MEEKICLLLAYPELVQMAIDWFFLGIEYKGGTAPKCVP